MHQVKRIHIESTTLCNSDCITCPHDKIERPKAIDLDIIKRVITEDCLEYRRSIDLFEFHNYNEPFIDFDLFYELASLVKERWGNKIIGVVSNGSIMTPEIADKLIDLDLAHLMFSVDGFSKKVFDAHRVGLKRDKVYKNIEYFLTQSWLKNGIKPSICVTVTEKNKHEVQQLINYWSIKYCFIGFHECDGRGGEGREKEMIDTFSEKPCDYAIDGVYILTNLDVVPCCEDWSGIEVMGNLREQTLSQIVEGEKYQSFRKLHITGEKKKIKLCENCKTNMIYGYETKYRNLKQ